MSEETGGVSERFSSFPITEEAQGKIQKLREAFTAVETAVGANCPAGRLLSIALTDLESAAMFAIKSIAHDVGSRK